MSQLGDQLERFLESLPADAGFCYSIRERLAVNQLLLELFQRGELPSEPTTLKTLLAPVLCGTAAQQTEFYRRFDKAWGKKKDEDHPPPLVRKPRKWIWWQVATALLAIVAAAGITWRLWTPHAPPPKPDVPGPLPAISKGQILSSDDKPLAGAEVWAAGQTVHTNTIGQFTFVPAIQPPTLILVYHPDYGARIAPLSSQMGSAQESDRGPSSCGFAESDKFGLGSRHTLSLEQQVTEVFVSTSSSH